MLISALALAETHWHCGEFSEDRHKYILRSVKEIIEEQGERRQEILTAAGAETPGEADGNSRLAVATHRPGICVLCLPARGEADEIGGTMLSQLMEMPDYHVETAPVASAASEMVDLVRQRSPRVVCISAMPPFAVMHARTLCKRLRGQVPEGNVVVALWHAQGDLNKAKDRIGCGDHLHVVATLADAQEQIRLLVQPLLLASEKQEQPDAGPRLEQFTPHAKETAHERSTVA